MKVLIYDKDTGGIRNYSKYLVDSLKKMNFDVVITDNLKNYEFDVIHIQFEHMIFHPFGLGLMPLLIMLKLKKKKIILTSHTVLAREEIYSRNVFFKFIKQILLPLDEKLMSLFYDKIIVHTDYSKKILMTDYKIPNKKIEVIPHGVY